MGIDRFANVGLGIAVLSQMRADERDKLQLHMHMPRSQGGSKRGPGDPVRELRMQRVCVERLGGWPFSILFAGALIAFGLLRRMKVRERCGLYQWSNRYRLGYDGQRTNATHLRIMTDT